MSDMLKVLEDWEHEGDRKMGKDMGAVTGTAGWAGAARRLLLGIAALLVTSTAALADPTTLICDTHESNQAGPFTVDLNEAQSTVSFHSSGLAPSGGYPGTSGVTRGPFPASFNPNTITFADDSPDAVSTYIINRVAATVEETDVGKAVSMTWHSVWTCQVGKAQF
jgi:hypothetical protein